MKSGSQESRIESDLMRFLLLLAASIGAMVLGAYLARAIAREPPAEESAAPEPPPALPPLADSPRRKGPHLDPAGARKGIVLATILGPCRALAPAEDDRS